MDPLFINSINSSMIGLAKVAYEALHYIKEEREVRRLERLVLSYNTEVLIYRDCSDILLAQTNLHSSLTVEDCHKEKWTNPSVMEAFEARFGVEKGNHLLAVLNDCLENIQLTGMFMALFGNLYFPSTYFEDEFGSDFIEFLMLLGRRGLSNTLWPAVEGKESVLPLFEQCVAEIRTTNKSILQLLVAQTVTTRQIAAAASLPPQWPSPNTHHPTIPSNTYPLYLDDTNTTGAILDLEAQDQGKDQELALTLSARASAARRLQIDQLPPRLSTWRILMQSGNSSYFCVQFSVLVLAVTITIVWSIMKGDLGTGTGLGGMVFGVGSTLSNVYERFFKRRKQKRGKKKGGVPLRLLE